MIQRRRPIESAIAKRRMFNMGGMAAPMQQMQAMGMPQQGIMGMPQQPMGMPQQAQGIMASSQPLVDAIAADAANPAGGDTLSMAQGGVVGFANGGLYKFPDLGGSVSNKTSVPSPLRTGLDIYRARNESDAERLQNIFPESAQSSLTDMEPTGISKAPYALGRGLGYAAGALGNIPGRAGTALGKAVGGAKGALSATFGFVDDWLGKALRGDMSRLQYWFSDDEETSGRSMAERVVLTNMIDRRPELANEIMEAGVRYSAKGLDDKTFAEQIARDLSIRYESGNVLKAAGIDPLDADATSEDQAFNDIEPGRIPEPVLPGDEEAFYKEDLNNKIEEYRIAMGQGPGAQMQFAQDLSADPNYTQEFKDAVLQSTDVGSSVNVEPPKGIVPPSAVAATANQALSDGLDNTLFGGAGTAEPPEVAIQENINKNQEFSTGQDSTLFGGAGSEVEILAQRRQASSDNQFKLFQALMKYGKDAPPGAKADAVTDVASSALRAASGDTSVDVAKLKSELEALIPAVQENDPETEGMLLVMLGAAVAGGESSNWVKNVADGVKQGLPDIIKYREKQKSAQKQRDMSIAKMAISQKFSLEAEQRALSRTIGAEDRAEVRKIGAEDRAQKRKDAEVKNYMVIKNTVVDASSFNSKLTGQLMIPSTTMLPLDAAARKKMAALNIPLMETGKMSANIKDLGTDKTTQLSLKQLNQLGKPDSMQIFKNGTNPGGFKLNFLTAKTAGFLTGKFVEDSVSPGNWNVIRDKYVQARKPITDLLGQMAELQAIDKTKLVGVGGIKGRIGDALRGLGSGSEAGPLGYFNTLGRELLGASKDSGLYKNGELVLSEQNKFEALGRLVLAKITPMILGESGRTISDADRARVAKALGFEIDETGSVQSGNYSFTITGRSKDFFANPDKITNALNETTKVLKLYETAIDSEFRSYVTKFAVNLPPGQTAQQLKKYESSRAPAALSPLKKRPSGNYFDLRKKI